MKKNYSNLPTFHPVMMEIADMRARARYDAGTAKLAARRAAWLKAQGLPERGDDILPPAGHAIVKLLKAGL